MDTARIGESSSGCVGAMLQDGPTSTRRFPTTNWTQVRRSAVSQDELGTMLLAYWEPVYAYIRRKGYDRQAALDLTQGFIADVLLQRNLLARADPELGRFRTYLLTALGRYLVDRHRSEVGRDGSKPVAIPTDAEILDATEPDDGDEPHQAFDRQWAATVLGLTLEQVEADCHANGLSAHWAIFHARVVAPACYASEPVPVDTLAREHSLREDQVYSRLNTVKRKLQNVFEAIILDTLEDPDDLASELSELRTVLALPMS